MYKCKNCNAGVETWLGDSEYCFSCMGDQEVMDRAIMESMVALVEDDIEVQPIAVPTYPSDIHTGLEIDTSPNKSAWNSHIPKDEK